MSSAAAYGRDRKMAAPYGRDRNSDGAAMLAAQ